MANATGKTIWAQVKDYRREVEVSMSMTHGKISASRSVKFEYEQYGFTKIPNRDLFRFPTTTDALVAVYTEDNEPICGPTRVKADHSVIATMGGLKNTKYGKIWEDERGRTW